MWYSSDVRRLLVFSVLLFGAAFVSCETCLHAEDNEETDVSSLLRAIMESEAIYRDAEMVWETTYKRYVPVEEEHEPQAVFTNLHVSVRSISQQGMLYLHSDAKGATYLKEGLATTESFGYDGELTRHVIEGDFVNIHHGRVEHNRILSPHMLPFSKWNIGNSLSAFIRDSKTGVKGVEYEWRDVVPETVDGLSCLRVSLNGFQSGGDVRKDVSRAHVWFAVDRNYLPVKLVGYVLHLSDSLPSEESQMSSFDEIEPGIWAPLECRVTRYRSELLLEGKHEIDNEHEFRIHKLDLDPDYPKSLFSDITLPTNLTHYVLVDGKIVSKTNPASTDANAVAAPPWFIVGNVILFAILIAAGLWWISRRRVRSRGGVNCVSNV